MARACTTRRQSRRRSRRWAASEPWRNSRGRRFSCVLPPCRAGEKWLFGAREKRGLAYDRLDDREVTFDLANPGPWRQYSVVLERSISFGRGLYACQVLNSWGIPTVNTAQVAATCGDKLATSAALQAAGVPQPHVGVARKRT